MQSVWSMLDGQYICIFILSSNRLFCLLVPDESFLEIQSKSYILYISNKIWFVCQAIPRRIYKISHINFCLFMKFEPLCIVLLLQCQLLFIKRIIEFDAMSAFGSFQRWYDWLRKLNEFSFDIYYFLWHLLHISYKAI